MKRTSLTFLVLTVVFMVAPHLTACPMCQEAAGSSQTGQNDAFFQARAFNRAIYLMVSMPYLLLGGLGFLCYQSAKRARRDAVTAREDP